MSGKRWRAVALLVVCLVGVACSSDAKKSTSSGQSGSSGGGQDRSSLPEAIRQIMDKPRYDQATWSLLVADVNSGEVFYTLNADDMSFTGSTRKLFSVGMALNTLGPDHRQETPVYRMGTVGPDGTLTGNLALVGGGDLTFGGRRDGDTLAIANFDHNDANSLGTATLTPQDPLSALNDLAKQVHDSGITTVSGDVVVDDRLFEPYRVPNGNLLITPVMLNENMVDVTVSPTAAGSPASLDYRPQTGAVTVANNVTTTAAGGESDLELSGDGLVECVGTPDCSGSVSGSIPADYEAPFKNGKSFVGTLRVEEPNAFMRTAFVEALKRNGVSVTAPAVGPNPVSLLPPQGSYDSSTRVASYESVPYAQTAKLVLKVSLNLGANLSLSLLGLDKGKRTVADALAAERTILTGDFKINGDQFNFPTNGSGSPDSKAAPRALVDLLTAMHKTKVAQTYQQALPILGVDGSLATTGIDLPGKGHVFAKTGTTVAPVEGKITLVAQNLAGYIETKSGRTVAYALLVNNAGELKDFEADIGGVITDEGTISSLIYESL